MLWSWYLRFVNGYDVPCMLVSFLCLLLFVSLFLALLRCLAVGAIEMLRGSQCLLARLLLVADYSNLPNNSPITFLLHSRLLRFSYRTAG
jgi:hypothetical protein